MAHTLPDYTTKYKMAKIFANIDEAELAARLGSLTTFDRRGNVVFYEDFEGTTLKWTKIDDGAGGSLDIVDTMSLTDDQSLKVTVGSGANKKTGILRRFQQIQLKQIGFEASFTWNANLDNFAMWCYIYTGALYFYPFLDLDVAEGNLQISKAGGGFTVLDSAFSLRDDTQLFHTVKMVIDLDTGYWMRVMVDDTEYNASAVKLFDAADLVTKAHIRWALQYNTTNAAVQVVHLDRLIMTQNEP